MRGLELKPLLAMLGLAILVGPARAEEKVPDQYCGMLPVEVTQVDAYAGWPACNMKQADEKRLWEGLAKGQKQVMRFTFTQGHGMFYRVIRIVEFDDGSATLKVFGTRNRRDDRHPERKIGTRREVLSAEELEQIQKLASDSGTWDHAIGTWDSTGAEEEIFIHCQVLEMERANADGYRFSSVNIGCNQPTKLMPLVNEIVRLARMENTNNGMLFE